MKQFRRIAPVWAAVGLAVCGNARADAFDDLKNYDYQNRGGGRGDQSADRFRAVRQSAAGDD